MAQRKRRGGGKSKNTPASSEVSTLQHGNKPRSTNPGTKAPESSVLGGCLTTQTTSQQTSQGIRNPLNTPLDFLPSSLEDQPLRDETGLATDRAFELARSLVFRPGSWHQNHNLLDALVGYVPSSTSAPIAPSNNIPIVRLPPATSFSLPDYTSAPSSANEMPRLPPMFTPSTVKLANKTATPTSTKKRKPTNKTWSTYPALHPQVACLLEEYGLAFTFRIEEDLEICTEEKNTNIFGRFACHNKTCAKTGWRSGIVATTISLYPGNQYHARVYHQRCDQCNELSKPQLQKSESYAERVAFWIKVWNGIEVVWPEKGKETPPHDEDRCEGCKAGRCRAGRRAKKEG